MPFREYAQDNLLQMTISQATAVLLDKCIPVSLPAHNQGMDKDAISPAQEAIYMLLQQNHSFRTPLVEGGEGAFQHFYS